MIYIIASINGDVTGTLGPVWHYEREVFHTASIYLSQINAAVWYTAAALRFPCRGVARFGCQAEPSRSPFGWVMVRAARRPRREP